MKRRLLAMITVVVGLGAAAIFVSPVGAAPITRTYDFSAVGFSAFSGAVPPTDPVNGSVTITFDAALTTLDFLVDAINLTIGAKTYSAAEVTADFPFGLGDALLIGATVKTNDELEDGTNDFAFVINDASTDHPALALFAYTTTETVDLFETSTGAVTSPVAGVPEPGSWLVLVSGLAGLLGYRSRRSPASAG
jgi:hypothetical protein